MLLLCSIEQVHQDEIGRIESQKLQYQGRLKGSDGAGEGFFRSRLGPALLEF